MPDATTHLHGILLSDHHVELAAPAVVADALAPQRVLPPVVLGLTAAWAPEAAYSRWSALQRGVWKCLCSGRPDAMRCALGVVDAVDHSSLAYSEVPASPGCSALDTDLLCIYP